MTECKSLNIHTDHGTMAGLSNFLTSNKLLANKSIKNNFGII